MASKTALFTFTSMSTASTHFPLWYQDPTSKIEVKFKTSTSLLRLLSLYEILSPPSFKPSCYSTLRACWQAKSSKHSVWSLQWNQKLDIFCLSCNTLCFPFLDTLEKNGFTIHSGENLINFHLWTFSCLIILSVVKEKALLIPMGERQHIENDPKNFPPSQYSGIRYGGLILGHPISEQKW